MADFTPYASNPAMNVMRRKDESYLKCVKIDEIGLIVHQRKARSDLDPAHPIIFGDDEFDFLDHLGLKVQLQPPRGRPWSTPNAANAAMVKPMMKMTINELIPSDGLKVQLQPPRGRPWSTPNASNAAMVKPMMKMTINELIPSDPPRGRPWSTPNAANAAMVKPMMKMTINELIPSDVRGTAAPRECSVSSGRGRRLLEAPELLEGNLEADLAFYLTGSIKCLSRFMPTNRVSQSQSTGNTIILDELTTSSSGLYRCEVSSEAPAFHTQMLEKEMLVRSSKLMNEKLRRIASDRKLVDVSTFVYRSQRMFVSFPDVLVGLNFCSALNIQAIEVFKNNIYLNGSKWCLYHF
ncbi:hypothetical protein GQR58_022497 [Nymphon striatum]|nr:hypothetical protein GQR58_022497 [Nymphon striatum]